MSKGKNCNKALRKTVKELQKAELSCSTNSKTMVFNASKYFSEYKTEENVSRKKKARKTTSQIDRIIVILSKQDPRKRAADIHREKFLFTWKKRMAHRLIEAGLQGRLTRKNPLVRASQQQRRIEFAREHKFRTQNQCRYILFSDETKLVQMIRNTYGGQIMQHSTQVCFTNHKARGFFMHGNSNLCTYICTLNGSHVTCLLLLTSELRFSCLITAGALSEAR